MGLVDGVGRIERRERGERRRAASWHRLLRYDDFDLGRDDGVDCPPERCAVGREDEPGGQQIDDVAQLAEVG